ncbi:MAG: DNA polymerase IV [Patescibacteria group bacterium]
MSPRIIAHVDMDAFFAAVEERENPAIRGKPVVVGAVPQGGQGRGVVSTANYEARKFGIRSSLPISQAYRLCPQAVFLPVDGNLYGQVSRRVMEILRPFAAAFQQVSVDEAYLDITTCGGYAEAKEVATCIKQSIKTRERLSASVGIGPNKLIAKIASGFQKPDGLTVVSPEQVQVFLDPLGVGAIPGIGPKSSAKLLEAGVRIVQDLRTFEKTRLREMFGVWGEGMYDASRGLDLSPVSEDHETKSIGRQTTFMRDVNNQAELTATLLELAREVSADARRNQFPYSTVTVTVRYANFETHTKAHTVKAPIQTIEALNAEVLRLLFPFLQGKRMIRLLGVRVS